MLRHQCDDNGPTICFGGELGFIYVECPNSGGELFWKMIDGEFLENPDGLKIVTSAEEAYINSTRVTGSCRICGSWSINRIIKTFY